MDQFVRVAGWKFECRKWIPRAEKAIYSSVDGRRLCFASSLVFVIVQVATIISLSEIAVPLCSTEGLIDIVQNCFLVLGSLDGKEQLVLFRNPKVKNRQS